MIVDDGRWLNNIVGVYLTLMIYIDDVGKYKSLVGVKLQKIVKLPRTSNVDAVVKIAPVFFFFSENIGTCNTSGCSIDKRREGRVHYHPSTETFFYYDGEHTWTSLG